MKKFFAAGAITLIALIPACSSDDKSSGDSDTASTAAPESAAPNSEESLRSRVEDYATTVHQRQEWTEAWNFIAPSCQATLEANGIDATDVATLMKQDYSAEDGSGQIRYDITLDGDTATIDFTFPKSAVLSGPEEWAFEDGQWGAIEPCTGTNSSTGPSESNSTRETDEAALKTTLQSYTTAVASGRGGEVYGYFSARCQAEVDEDQFIEALEAFVQELPQGSELSLEHKMTGADSATVTYFIDDEENGTPDEWIVEDGSWVVNTC